MKNFNAEMIEKAKTVKSAEELLELAKANGVEITEDEAKTYFVQLNPKGGELDDSDLENVAGGSGCLKYFFGKSDFVQVKMLNKTCPNCGAPWAEIVTGYDIAPRLRCKYCKYELGTDDGSIEYEIIE
jgi:hypothetical protein